MAFASTYTAVHKAPRGPGDDRPTAGQIIKDAELKDAFRDKVVLITGCSSGLGVETAKALAMTGATLYLTARNLVKAREALGDLISTPNTQIHLLELDLTSLASVRSCAEKFLSQSTKLHVLITNAGIRNTAHGLTKDNFEQQFQVDHLSHFLLFQLLKPTLLVSSTPEFHSRVIALSSSGHRTPDFPINFADLSFTANTGSYTPARGYAQAKLANIYMTNEINRRYGGQGINANAVMPGGIMTGLQQGVNGGALWEVLTDWRLMLALPKLRKEMKNAEQGAATTVWATVSSELEGRGGMYLENCNVAGPAQDGAIGIDPGYGKFAFDGEAARKLWEVSCDLVGLKNDAV